MKRRDFVRYLLSRGCELWREGGRHSVFIKLAAGKSSTLPRHGEINPFLVIKICKDLEIPPPEGGR